MKFSILVQRLAAATKQILRAVKCFFVGIMESNQGSGEKGAYLFLQVFCLYCLVVSVYLSRTYVLPHFHVPNPGCVPSRGSPGPARDMRQTNCSNTNSMPRTEYSRLGGDKHMVPLLLLVEGRRCTFEACQTVTLVGRHHLRSEPTFTLLARKSTAVRGSGDEETIAMNCAQMVVSAEHFIQIARLKSARSPDFQPNLVRR